jgi:1,4-dihydroxy-2-naphthoate octaprenyltransferase
VCLNDEERHQIGFLGMVRAASYAVRRRLAASVYPSGMLVFTQFFGHLGNVGSYQLRARNKEGGRVIVSLPRGVSVEGSMRLAQ